MHNRALAVKAGTLDGSAGCTPSALAEAHAAIVALTPVQAAELIVRLARDVRRLSETDAAKVRFAAVKLAHEVWQAPPPTTSIAALLRQRGPLTRADRRRLADDLLTWISSRGRCDRFDAETYAILRELIEPAPGGGWQITTSGKAVLRLRLRREEAA